MIKGGLCAICAMCEYFWNARGRNKNDIDCGKKCGGPVRGMTYPMYKGPLGNNIHTICFICGNYPDGACVDIGGKGIVGICNEHIDLFKKMINSEKHVKINVKEKEVIKIGDMFNNKRT